MIALELASDHQDVEGRVGGLRPGGGVELHRHGPVRLAAAAREPDRRAHDPAGLRVVPLHAAGGELAAWSTPSGWSPGACGAPSSCTSALSFPTGRLTTGLDRTLAIAGYFVFPLAFVPALLFSGPHELNCDDCPTNLLLVRRDADVAAVLTGLGALCYLVLFAVVLAWAVRRWRGTPPDRPPPAHAGLHLLAAHLPARDRGQGGRGRRGAMAGVHLDPPDAVRLPRRPAAHATCRCSTPSCARAWRSCAPRARGSWRPAMPSAGAWSATCTTARNRASWRSSCC